MKRPHDKLCHLLVVVEKNLYTIVSCSPKEYVLLEKSEEESVEKLRAGEDNSVEIRGPSRKSTWPTHVATSSINMGKHGYFLLSLFN
ncbi:unnamed protein product [Sphenostylis stenocarpa]|uniref:Uncharacterized protein n=1 Tax=Sphenostylis stenocarpa TaxID=92480 RepID=A0AA86S290_9FABA|nr:unnamed protein product [Sphenostylis stenocarpa]